MKIDTIKNEEENKHSVKIPLRTSGRLDLNDLIKRAKFQRKEEKKNNIIIISAIVAVAAIVLMILSL